MKRNKRFFVIVTAMLLASSAVLTGCMYSIKKDYGDSKPYSAESQISISDVLDESDAPTAQSELQEKFKKMLEISEDGNSVTVISKASLDAYWKNNYGKKVSLSTDEVYYIVQDSIWIYEKYDTVILPSIEFQMYLSDKQELERAHDVEEKIIAKNPSQYDRDYDTDIANIHDIIMYRLTALSSPKAFFTGAEAVVFCGFNPSSFNGLYPENVFYIPDYSEDTDRDYILYFMGGPDGERDRIPALFAVSAWGGCAIEFYPKIGEAPTTVFPTYEMKSSYILFCTTTPGGITSSSDDDEIIYGPSFLIQPYNSFYLSLATPVSTAVWGSVEKQGDKLILLPYYNEYSDREAEYRYVFYPFEEIGYKYCRAESKPVTGYDFDDGTIFYYEK